MGEQRTAAELGADIEQTREDLAQTVDLLSAKLDVKGRVKGRMGQVTTEATDHLRAAKEQAVHTPIVPAAGVAAALAAVVVALVWRRHHAARRTGWGRP